MPDQRKIAFNACFTVDVEQDCPPFLETCRGMTEGLPRLLDLLLDQGVRGTFFTTGEMARRFPAVIHRLVDEGHELACHGDLHRDFTTLTPDETRTELARSMETLTTFGPVVSFRAPYLRFPAGYLSLLVEHGLSIDSSVARYKRGEDHRAGTTVPGLIRVPASVTSSVLRLPRFIRAPWIRAAGKPVVLFVHPWEAVDFRRSPLRWDCRFRTGHVALRLWGDLLEAMQRSRGRFLPLRDIAPPVALPLRTEESAQPDTPLQHR